MKTNKSYSKRLKLTKTGKVLARKSGQNHFNAKASRGKASRGSQLAGKKMNNFVMKNKDRGRFLPAK